MSAVTSCTLEVQRDDPAVADVAACFDRQLIVGRDREREPRVFLEVRLRLGVEARHHSVEMVAQAALVHPSRQHRLEVAVALAQLAEMELQVVLQVQAVSVEHTQSQMVQLQFIMLVAEAEVFIHLLLQVVKADRVAAVKEELLM